MIGGIAGGRGWASGAGDAEGTNAFPSGADQRAQTNDTTAFRGMRHGVVFLYESGRLAGYAARQTGQHIEVSIDRVQNARRA